jgi:hypothetical protein
MSISGIMDRGASQDNASRELTFDLLHLSANDRSNGNVENDKLPRGCPLVTKRPLPSSIARDDDAA